MNKTDAIAGPTSWNSAGPWHGLAHWSLGHPKLCTTLAVLGFLAFCGWKAWAAFYPVHPGANRDPDGPMLEDYRDRMSVILTGVLGWIFVATVVVRGALGSMKWSAWHSRSLNARVRERILRGVPIRGGALIGYAFFALVGLGLGLALIAQELSLLPWLGSTAARILNQSVGASVLAVSAVISAVRLLWQILVQTEWDSLVGDRRAEVAEAFLSAEEAEREEDREEERKVRIRRDAQPDVEKLRRIP